jgi:hypothetical protein
MHVCSNPPESFPCNSQLAAVLPFTKHNKRGHPISCLKNAMQISTTVLL